MKAENFLNMDISFSGRTPLWNELVYFHPFQGIQLKLVHDLRTVAVLG
jgi:hypothetical protein